MQTAFIAFSLLLIVASFVSAYNWRVWYIYGLRAQRLQLGIILIVLLILFPFCKTGNTWFDLTLSISMIGAIIFDFYKIFPFTPFAKNDLPGTKKEDNAISFITANVRMCNEKFEFLLEQIKTICPDVILLTEVDQRWIERVNSLEDAYQYTCLQPQDNTYGMALYSKFPLKDIDVKFLVEENIPSIHCMIQFRKGQQIQFTGLHPRPPAPWTREEHKDMELIIAAAETNMNNYPSVVSGDLNDVAWSPATRQFKAVSGLIDPRVGRGFFNTYNAFIPFFRMPIDHFFVSRQFKLIAIKRLKKFGSDHYPIYLRLNLDAA